MPPHVHHNAHRTVDEVFIYFLCSSLVFHTLSHHYLRKGDVTKAFRMAEESIEVAKSTRPDDHPDIAICNFNQYNSISAYF